MLLAEMQLLGLIVSLCLLAFGLTPEHIRSIHSSRRSAQGIELPQSDSCRGEDSRCPSLWTRFLMNEAGTSHTPLPNSDSATPRKGSLLLNRPRSDLFDTHYIFFAVKCFDSNPSGIVATELRRDAEMEGDDMFEVMFDTFDDHRNGYRFRVNALGTLRDQLINDEGRVVNDNWDEKWDARAKNNRGRMGGRNCDSLQSHAIPQQCFCLGHEHASHDHAKK